MLKYEHYMTMLPLHKHRLDDDLEIQPQLMEQIASSVVVTNSRMLEAKESLAQLEGRLLTDLKDDDPKLTVAMIDASIRRDPQRTQKWMKYQEARATHEKWVGLLDAWKQRGYSIKTLADLYSAQYFSLDHHQARPKHPGRPDNSPDAQDQARAAMRRSSTPDPEPIRRRTLT